MIQYTPVRTRIDHSLLAFAWIGSYPHHINKIMKWRSLIVRYQPEFVRKHNEVLKLVVKM